MRSDELGCAGRGLSHLCARHSGVCALVLIETFLTPSGTRWERRLVLMLLAFKVQGEHPILALAAKALPLSDRKACLVASSSLQGRAQLPTWLLWILGPAQGFLLLKNTAVLDLFLRSQITVRFFFPSELHASIPYYQSCHHRPWYEVELGLRGAV